MEDISCWQSKLIPCSYSDKLLDLLSFANKRTNSIININEVKKSIYYTRKYHGTQCRKSGEPYYSHPIEVAYLFAQCVEEEARQYYTTDLVITAVLHDVIEDTTLTKDMITQIFNKSVANKVEDLTRVKFDKKITAGETVNLLFTQYKKGVLHIKLLDRLHNMRTIKCMSPEKIKKIVDETIVYFIPLASYLSLHKIKQELAKLCMETESTQQDFIPPSLEKESSLNHSYPLCPISRNVLEKIYNPKG